jgi:1-aminocyclopropane-1-carboxylate deaminase/D-cysteine desulfhydrase-like pyridoxal-dependent ACC family enzyme
LGADVRLVDEGFDIGIRKSLERAIEEVKAKGGKPYAIPAGASMQSASPRMGRAPRVIGIDASATPKQTKAQGLEIARKWRPLSSGSGPARRRSRRNDGTAWGGRYFLIATSIVARQVNSTRL